MNAKENYLSVLNHKKGEWIPVEGEGLAYTGFEGNEMEKGPFGGGYDWFGVPWTAPESGGGTAIPAPGKFLISSETICDWDKLLKFPDPSSYHWKEDAEVQLEGVDREVTAVDYGDGNGPYERLAAFMGFAEALMSMAEEPEAVAALFERITDYKIECLDYIAEYYRPDTYTLYDDCATQQSPFMSPIAYKELISPQHKRIATRAKELGMLPIIHCCGHAEALAEFFIDEGFDAWSSVQPCNDIVRILEKYGGRLSVSGGYNTNGRPGTTVDTEIIDNEIRRCFETYGDLPGYIFAGFIMPAPDEGGQVDFFGATGLLCERAIEYTHRL